MFQALCICVFSSSSLFPCLGFVDLYFYQSLISILVFFYFLLSFIMLPFSLNKLDFEGDSLSIMDPLGQPNMSPSNRVGRVDVLELLNVTPS